MPNYGFAIDLRKCIGCHACTIACKAEHEIPVGVNRCWVKTVEKGTFPDTRRFFFPVLCNQCDEAPCARICPTNALFKRRDGIVDLHGDSCIGCRACMEACPYDQLFIDPNTHTAEKCNFCANRVENKLLPACVSVCPTECRIFGDLDDPASEVARIVQHEASSVRKPEKGTSPKIFYLGAEDSAIQPGDRRYGRFIYKEGQVHLRPLGSPTPRSRAGRATPRVDYDVPHDKPWGVDMVLYLLHEGDLDRRDAARRDPVAARRSLRDRASRGAGHLDRLHHRHRRAPGGRSRAAGALLLHPDAPELAIVDGLGRVLSDRRTARSAASGSSPAGSAGRASLTALVWPAIVVSLLATGYTGFLFAQGLARDLWQGPHAAFDLIAQSGAEGAASLLLASALARRRVGSPCARR